jgi:anaerobic ribonucleoside-triphosphate reductase activating protein
MSVLTLKYVDTLVSFSEIPDEISLCINISNCPNNCKGCHSAYLKGDIGEELNVISLYDIIKANAGVTCVCFMGGDQNPKLINDLAFAVHLLQDKPREVAWYSGSETIHKDIALELFTYIKIGPYIEELGPLTNPNTNQKMYKVTQDQDSNITLTDITYKFWKNDK